jgi:hypothetical protein
LNYFRADIAAVCIVSPALSEGAVNTWFAKAGWISSARLVSPASRADTSIPDLALGMGAGDGALFAA